MSRLAGCPILVVEDDPDLRYMMVQMLALEGFDPEGASDGVEALQRLRSPGRRPRVIVLDMTRLNPRTGPPPRMIASQSLVRSAELKRQSVKSGIDATLPTSS